MGFVQNEALQDLLLLGPAGVVDQHLEHEAVKLRLRQGVRALLLDRVLGSQHQERLLQGKRDAADGYLALLHRLQQGGLHLGRRPVHLIGQDDVGEDGPLADVELSILGVVDLGTGDVGREQVRRELDAHEGGGDAAGEGAHGERLGQAGHALDQDMAPAEEAHQEAVDERFLADDDARRLRLHQLDEAALLAHPRVNRLDVYSHSHARRGPRIAAPGWAHSTTCSTPGRGRACGSV